MNSTAAVLRKIKQICKAHTMYDMFCDVDNCPIAEWCLNPDSSNELLESTADIIDEFEEKEEK